MYTLYLWGIDGKGHPISGESIALVWYLQRHACESELEVVFGNNTDMSPIGKLPVLYLNDEEYVHGIESIIKALCPQIYSRYSSEQNLMERAAMSILDNDLRLLNEYQLYLDKKNYVEYTRKQFSRLFYFPFNYNSAYEMRNKAKIDCAHLEYLSIDDDDITGVDGENNVETSEDYELAQSKTFKLKGMKKRQQVEELKSIRLNRKYMRALVEFLEQWDDVSNSLSSDSPAFYLFYAYMYVQMTVLPNGEEISEYLKDKKGIEYVDKITNTCDNYQSEVNNKLRSRDATFREQGSLVSSVLHRLHV
ncbi:Sorting assembly machinery 37 kDa subunit [Nakaseomyces bracarensis]|uniref:Sorting assembly machinery 37 kDa subunit n=1 Tax=Nakaseomyces bracarensis TaxID=273131 RepID=A0ABR4NW16_9SACH